MKKVETADYILEYDTDPERILEIFEKLLDFFIKNEVFLQEDIMQADEVIMDAPKLLSDIAENVFKFELTWKE